LLVGESVSAAVRRLGWPKFSCGGDERVSLAAFSSAGCEAPKVGFVRVRLAGNCQRLALVSAGLHFKSPAGADWLCLWQSVSVAKVNGFVFGIRVGGPAWDGRRAASESWAEVSLREFEIWLKQKSG